MTNEIKLVVVAVAAAVLFATGILVANARLRTSSDLPVRTVELGLTAPSGSDETSRGQQTPRAPQVESSIVRIVRIVRYGSVQEYQPRSAQPFEESDEKK